MEEEFWHQRWQQNQIGFHENEFNSHLQKFWYELDVPDNSGIFVPLCGKSRDLLWLRSRGYKVTGVEISPIAVSDFFKENKLQPEVSEQGKFERWEADGITILRGDFFNLTTADVSSCAAVYDRASLVALPQEMRGAYVRHLQGIIAPALPILLITLEYHQNEMDGPPFSVTAAEVNEHYSKNKNIRHLFSADLLDESPGFKKRGVSELTENVFLLT